MGKLDTCDGATVRRRRGLLHVQCGQLFEARASFDEARRALEGAEALQTCEGAHLASAFGSLGSELMRSGDSRGALQAFNDARSLQELLKAAGSGHIQIADVAAVLNYIGVVKGMLGDQDGALAAHSEADAMRRGISS